MGTSNGNLSYHMHQDGEEVQLQVTFSSHCEQKVNKLLGMIRHSYTYLDNDTVKTLYTSLIRPHLEYGNTAWTPRFKKDMSLIESVQIRATKLSPAIKDLPYEQRLRILNLPSLYY